MKKFVSVFLAMLLVFSAVGNLSFAAEAQEYANVAMYFPLYGEYGFSDALNSANVLVPPSDGNAIVGADFLSLHRNNSSGNPDNTGHLVSNRPGEKITGNQISFAFNAKVDATQSRTPSAEEAEKRTIFLYGSSDYSKNCITLRYYLPEQTAAVVLVQNGADAVVASFPRPSEDIWHSYAISLDAQSKLIVYVDGVKVAEADAKGIGADSIGGDTIRLNRATSSNTINVDSCYRDLRFIKGIISEEQVGVYAAELKSFAERIIKTQAPTMSVSGGSESNPVDTYEPISMNHPNEGSVIYYTLDGTDPDETSTKYTEPFHPEGTALVKAVAIAPDGTKSDIASAYVYSMPWTATAAEFRIEGENTINNAKVAWPVYPGATKYEIYRDGNLIGTATGDCFDEYDLEVNKNYKYTVKAIDGANVLAEGTTNTITTFAINLDDVTGYDDNVNGKWVPLINGDPQPSGYNINGKYYKVKTQGVSRDEFVAAGFDGTIWDNTCSITSIRFMESDDGLQWPEEWTIAYPIFVDMRLEGAQNGLHPDKETIVYTAHAEGTNGYGAAKLFLAAFKPGRDAADVAPYGVTVSGGKLLATSEPWEQQETIENPGRNQLSAYYVGRPCGYDSRDMVRFGDGDDLYIFGSTNMNQDMYILKLDETWTKPEKVVNVILKGRHQESPGVFHDGDSYYVYTSTTNGWFVSQARYSSTKALDQPWSPLREIANAGTFGTQGNGVWGYGSPSGRFVHRGHGYNWGQSGGWRKSNYQRFWHMAINEGVATGNWCYRMEYHPYWGAIAVQSGEYVSLGKKATLDGKDAPNLTDNLQLQSSPITEVEKLPYDMVVDLEVPTVITEVNLTNAIYMGSACGSYYKAYGSNDMTSWTLLADQTGEDYDDPTFRVGWVEDTNPYRYVKVTVEAVKNLQNGGQSALWGGKPLELAIYGKPMGHVDEDYQFTDEVLVGYDRNNIDFEAYGQAPVIVNSRTMVPLRAIFETMGAQVDWNEETRTVTAVRGDVTVSLAIDSDQLYVNGTAVTIDTPAQIINNRTMVPVRAIAESFNCEVDWNEDARRVYISEAE